MTENKVLLIGHLGTEPSVEERYAKMKLCTNRNFKNKETDEWESEAEWHSLTLFGDLVMKASTFFKGDLVCVWGRLTYNVYEKDGVRKYFTDIIVNSIKLVNRKANTGEEALEQFNNEAKEVTVPDELDDDLPF